MVRSNLPQTADSAMELAGYLMNGLVRNQEEDKNGKGTRKEVEEGKTKKGKEKEEGSFNYTRPICQNCGKRHHGKCLRPTNFSRNIPLITCNFCK